MNALKIWLFLFVVIEAKQPSKKLKGLLQNAEQEVPTKTKIKLRDAEDECKICRSGFHKGIINPIWFEYVGKHGIMTADEAVSICEKDLACGGFTFYGHYLPDRKYFVYFVHYIPFISGEGIDSIILLKRNDWLWTTYRSKKKVIILSGKPYLSQTKIPLKLSEGHKKNEFDGEWPYEKKIVAVSYKADFSEAKGHTNFQFEDQNYANKEWKTIIRNEPEATKSITDGSTWTLKTCCRPYEKPLADVQLRFTPKLHDNIQTIQCHQLEDFEDKFVRFKIPVKITGCKKVPSIVLDQLQWTGKIGKIGAKSFDVIGMEDKERRELFKDNFLGKLEAPLDSEELEFSNDVGKRSSANVIYVSGGCGQHLNGQKMDFFDIQIKGTKWWAIPPPMARNYLCGGCTDLDDTDNFWTTNAWFDSIQPQLYFSRFYGREFSMTMQNPGDIIYVPYGQSPHFYAVEDSLSLTKQQITVGNLDQESIEVDAEKLTAKIDFEMIKKNSEEWARYEIEMKDAPLSMIDIV